MRRTSKPPSGLAVGFGLATGLAVLTAWSTAAAEPMDLALERLVTDTECQQGPGGFGTFNPDVVDETGRVQCNTDDVAFKKLVSQLGFAFAPTALAAVVVIGPA